jgi:hypothetical protein
MENRLDNIFDWISKIILTCNNDFHFEAVDKLISLYYEREKNEEKHYELIALKIQRWNEIHCILT